MLIHSKSYQKNMAFVCQICSCFQVTTIKCKWHSPCTYHSNNSSTISRGITLFLYFFYHFLKTVIYTGPWLRLCNFTGPIQPTFFSPFLMLIQFHEGIYNQPKVECPWWTYKLDTELTTKICKQSSRHVFVCIINA